METNTDTIPTTTTFEVGQTYQARSFCDYECVWEFRVTKRTACFVTIEDTTTGDTKRAKVRTWRDVEQCDPLGRYSMSPVLSADKVSA